MTAGRALRVGPRVTRMDPKAPIRSWPGGSERPANAERTRAQCDGGLLVAVVGHHVVGEQAGAGGDEDCADDDHHVGGSLVGAALVDVVLTCGARRVAARFFELVVLVEREPAENASDDEARRTDTGRSDA